MWTTRASRSASESFHVAPVSPAGLAEYTQFAVMVGKAQRVAEGWVRREHG
jgi:hypothetical protein